MALQSALTRLRNDEEQLQSANVYQTRSNNKTKANSVFSIDEETGGIFNIDNDIFSSADVIFSPLLMDGSQTGQEKGRVGALNSGQTSLVGSSHTSSHHSMSPAPSSSLQTQTENEKSSREPAGKTPPFREVSTSTGAPLPSPNSRENLKTFTFTKQPSSQNHKDNNVGNKFPGFAPPTKQTTNNNDSSGPPAFNPPAKWTTDNNDSNAPRGFKAPTKRSTDKNDTSGPPAFEPPTKRISLSTPPIDSTEVDEESEHCLLDQSLLAAFMSEPDDLELDNSHSDLAPLLSHTSESLHNQAVSNSDTVGDSSFKEPSSSLSLPSSSLLSRPLPAPLPLAPVVGSSFKKPTLNSQRSAINTPTFPGRSLSQTSPVTQSSHHFPQMTDRTLHNTARHSQTNNPRLVSNHSATPSAPLPPSSFSTPQCVVTPAVRRKFPGPAGVLPALVAGQSMDNLVIPTPSLPTPSSTPRVKTLLTTPSKFHITNSRLIPQSGDGDPLDFSQGPWVTMLQDLDMNDVYSAPLLKCTIARAIQQASRKKLRNGKVTHLRVLLKSIVPACRSTSAVLKDPTGEILCTIHQSVMEEHRHELHPGAVLILRQVTVFSPAPRKHYLSITPDNIVIVYPSSDDNSTATLTEPRTICLTEVEKRFREQSSTKENSPQLSLPPTLSTPLNSPQSTQSNGHTHRQSISIQPLPVSTRHTAHMQSSMEAAPPTPLQDHHTNTPTQQPSHYHQPMDSIFTDQLCEDEFDSIMCAIGNELDF